MISKRISRRAWLGGLGAAAITLPYMRTLRAETVAPPKRLLIWFTPNGKIEAKWRPIAGASETDFQLSSMLAPLEPHKSLLTIFGAKVPDAKATNIRVERGISIKAARDLPSGGHGLSRILTGRAEATRPDGGDWGAGPSVDQFIADALKLPTPLRSLELGVRTGAESGNPDGLWLNYRAAGEPIIPENDPQKAFEIAFGNFVPANDPVALAKAVRSAERKQSVLDHAATHFQRLQPKLGSDARQRLDIHLSYVRELEQKIEKLKNPPLSACEPPALDPLTKNAWNEWTNVPDAARLQMDLMAAVFACDLTRIGTIELFGAARNAQHPWLGSTTSYHGLSHDAKNPDSAALLEKIGIWESEQLAYLISRLSELPEVDGSGSVMDNTLILWVNEISDGIYHTHQNMPFLLAGTAGGALSSGRFVQVEDQPHNNLLLSVCQLMGVAADSFGDPAVCTGPLTGLV